jgi:hypothetical protein
MALDLRFFKAFCRLRWIFLFFPALSLERLLCILKVVIVTQQGQDRGPVLRIVSVMA